MTEIKETELGLKSLNLGNESPLITMSNSILDEARDSPLFESSSSVLDHAQKLSNPALDNLITTQDAKPWLITSEYATFKPIVEEELSKIHEEIAKQNQDNNELRKENKEQRGENEQLKQENEKLKSKLKKAKDKAKFTNQMQQEIDDLQIDMNGVKDLVDWKRYNK